MRGWLHAWLIRIPGSVCVLMSLVSQGDAQSSGIAPTNPLGRSKIGWQLHNVTTSFGYSTLALPATQIPLGIGLDRLESDYDGTASASFGYNYNGGKSSVSMLYSPSLVRRVRYSRLSALNQSLALTVSRKLAGRWELGASLVGVDATLDQILFTPAVLSVVNTPAATLDDLLGAIRGGQYTGDQLASILTGTPYVATPSRSVIFGSKYFSTSLTSFATHRFSPRLAVTFSGGTTRSQTRKNAQNDLQSLQNFLIPQTTTAQSSASVNYQLSPRTEIGVRGSGSWIDSTLNRYLLVSTDILLSRKMSPHWFFSISGGPMKMITQTPLPITAPVRASNGQGFTAQGNIGHALGRTSSLMGSYGRSTGDTYGFGSQSSETIAGSWQWVLPGRGWAFYGGGGFQRLDGGYFGNFQSWYASGGVSRMLSRKASVAFSCGYVQRTTGADSAGSLLRQNLNGFNTRVTLVWNPFGNGEAQVPGAAGTAR